MKSKLLLQALLWSSIGLSTLSASASTTSQTADFRGSALPSQASVNKTIVIDESTQTVRVDSATAVSFVIGGKVFNWNFGTVNGSVIPFDLQQIAPQGLLSHPVTVYVADSDIYRGI